MKRKPKFPNFYQTYDWSPKNDKGVIFAGREIELRDFWQEIHNLIDGDGKNNTAYIGHRKLGKTTFLERCYNLVFWEQSEVLPYYYSFPQQEEDKTYEVQEIAEQMSLDLLKQAIAFMTKDPEVLNFLFEELLYDYIHEKKLPKASLVIKTLKMAKTKRLEAKGPARLRIIWQVCDALARMWNKKPLIIIDEAQEMDLVLCENGKITPCGHSITDIIQQRNILTVVSGSLVSVLVHKFLSDKIANRFSKMIFTPLEQSDAYRLIQNLCDDKAYSGIEKDIYDLVGGNPYYIRTLLLPTKHFTKVMKKEKIFNSQKNLREIYDFEVFHQKGEIYDFWRRHLTKYSHSLNNDPKGKKGLSIKILYKIATSEKNSLSFEELSEEFAVKIPIIREKVLQLRDADLIESPFPVTDAYKIADKVLGVVVANYFYRILFGSKKQAEEEIDRLTRLENRVEKLESNVKTVKQELLFLSSKEVKSAQGLLSLRKGIKNETIIHKKLQKGAKKQQGIFKGYQCSNKFQSINVASVDGSGCQIDLFAEMRAS